MPIKRVAIHISLPDAAFKRKVFRIAKKRGKDPSQEFVDLYTRLMAGDRRKEPAQSSGS